MASFLLIDGSNYLFRAFHGLPDLRTSTNEPTGALKGFMGMLGKVLNMVKPDYAVIVFDAPGKTFRHEIFPAYKANRPPMPDDLRVQIEPIHQAIRLAGWPLISIAGVEADDVIGTLAKRAKAQGYDTYIASGDKDLAQVVEEGITLVNTMNMKRYDREGVIEKYGVPPERIIDYLSLMGDKVDNVPGIEKCGPVTAAKWINLYGSLEEVIAHADEVKGKIGEKLRAGLDQLDESKALVTIKLDCELPDEVPFDINGFAFYESEQEALQTFCQRWEMNPVNIRRASGKIASVGSENKSVEPNNKTISQVGQTLSLFGEESPDQQVQVKEKAPSIPVETLPERFSELDEIKYALISTKEELAAFLKKWDALPDDALPVGISLLKEGKPRSAQIYGIGIALNARDVVIVDLMGQQRAALIEGLRPYFEGAYSKVFHDAKSAWHALAHSGLTLGGDIHDTMLMSYVLEAHLNHDLSHLARRLILRPIEQLTDLVGKGAKTIAMAEIEKGVLFNWLTEQTAATRACSSVMLSKLILEPQLNAIYENLEQPVMKVLYRMESTGVGIDAFSLAQQSQTLAIRIEEIKQAVFAIAGREFNLSSPKQLGEILFKELNLPVVKKTASGAPSTDEEVLNTLALDYALPKKLLEYRQLTKLKSTYTDKLPVMADVHDGRIHTTFGQATAVTGRLASSEPNLQNIPVRTPEGRKVREAFVAQDGWKIISADYSQIELRIMAHLSQDPGLLKAFSEGQDVHRATAAEVFGVDAKQVSVDQRRMAKVINFGLIYGMSAFGLAQNLGIDRSMAKAYMETYFARYPKVHQYMEAMRVEVRKNGYVSTAFGRRLWIPDIQSSRKPLQAGAERAAINAPMQGTAADLIKRAMIATDRYLIEKGLRAKLVLQVHDELILEVPEDEVDVIKEHLPRLMAEVAQFSVPLLAEVGVADNWDAAH